MNPVWAVFRKEMVDSLRDRRSLLSLLVYPLIGPLLVGLMFAYLGEREISKEQVRLPVVGQEHAPGLVQSLKDSGIEVVDGPADPEAAVRQAEVDLVLIIPEGFAERFRAARPAPLELVVDRSSTEAHSSVKRVKQRLSAIGARTAALRLLARGVDPQLVRPLDLTEVDVSTPQRRAAHLFGIIPMFVLLAAFIGGMHVATDCTAGERERGSLEPLLITPVPRRALVLGKWLTTVVLSAADVALTLGVTLAVLAQVPLEGLGLRFSVTLADASWLLAIALPLALFAPAAQLTVALFARSYKEAQAYLSYMILVPTLPGVLLSVMQVQSELWMAAVPILGQQLLLMDVIRGEPVSAAALGLALASAVACTLACLVAAARLFRREQIIFGR
ncbi:MAG: ABC transporter permease [Deltaproteobacteria bacterium]|jgi:sodium transport system permease protein|nr:ABC transporter permease [Deltaproteobacteria bacterium]MBW2536809.1 ABC transporter permease [Deltaproteobacteria bacterium]